MNGGNAEGIKKLNHLNMASRVFLQTWWFHQCNENVY